MKAIKRISGYFYSSIKGSFKHRIGSNYSTKEHQYWNVWTNKVWFEKYKEFPF